MEWQELLQDLINLVETAAPKLWEIALQQVWVVVLQLSILSIVLLITSATLLKLGFYCVNKYKDERSLNDWDTTAFVSFFGSGVSLIAIIILLTAIIGRVVNPEYYAIKILMDYIK